MKRTARNFSAFIMFATALSLGGLTVAAHAGDWPQWRGPDRDAKAAGFNAPQTWPPELTQKWKMTVGQGNATPALVGDRLYVFARDAGGETTLCLDATTGKELWRDKYEAMPATGAAGRHPGPRSSPVVANGKVVTYGVRGTLSCLEAASGKVLWRKDDFPGALPRFFTSSSPLITDGLCIAQLGGEDKGGLIAYDLATGESKWKWTDDGTAYASPVVATLAGTRVLLTLTANNIVALDVADGKLLWKAAFPPQRRAYNAATPIVDGQTVIYTGGGRGTFAVKLEMAGDSLTAKEVWSNPDIAVQFNTPVLKNGLLFGLTERDEFFCLNADNGKTAWTAASGGRRGFGSIVDAGAVLMGLTPSSQLIVFEPNAKEYKQLASYKVAENEIYAYPVPAGNGVYIKDQDSVAFWTFN